MHTGKKLTKGENRRYVKVKNPFFLQKKKKRQETYSERVGESRSMLNP